MALSDRLEQIGRGTLDLFSAPVGLIWDTARAAVSDEYNPGFTGLMGITAERAGRGLAQLGEGTGFSALGRSVGEATPIDNWFKAFIDEAELIYSTEFQRQQNRAPIGLRDLGVQPGEISLQRGAATVTGAAGAALPGGQPIGDVFSMWERAGETSPGRAFVDNLLGYYQRTPAEQQALRANVAYNLVTGTIDATSRWFLQPEVIAGKGIKTARRAYNPDPAKILQRAAKSARRQGYDLTTLVDDAGEVITQDGVRMMQLKGRQAKSVYHVTRRSQLGSKVSDDIDEEALGQLVLDLPEQAVGARAGEAIDLDEVPEVRELLRPEDKGLFLHTENQLDDAKRYAAQLHAQNPNDPPIIVKLNAEGLPVVYSDFDNPIPGKAKMMTMADRFGDDEIEEVIQLSDSDLSTIDGVLPHQEPARQLDSDLFRPDGTAREPGEVVPWDEGLRDDFLTASRLWDEGRGDAVQKYLKARARQRALSELPDSANPYDMAMNHRGVQQLLNRMDDMSPDEIRRQVFPEHPMGQMLSHYLGTASSYQERRIILAASMGYKLPDFNILASEARTRLDRILTEWDRIKAGKPPDEAFSAMAGARNRLSEVPAEEIDDVFREMVQETGDVAKTYEFLERVSDAAPLTAIRTPVNRRIGAAIRRTNFYQSKSLSRPIRSVVENKPHQWINVQDSMADVQLVRQLQEARPLGIHDRDISRFRERFMAAANDAEKISIVEESEDFIIQKAADMMNLSQDDFRDSLNKARSGRSQVVQRLESRRYASEGRDVLRHYDDESGELVEQILPLFSTQAEAYRPMVDVREVIKHAKNFRRIKESFGYDAAREILTGFNLLWKPTVLIRGGWPLRVVSDEQLRVLAKTGSLVRHLTAMSSTGKSPQFTEIFKKGLNPGQRLAEGYGLITGVRPLTSFTHRVGSFLGRGARKLRLVDPEWAKWLDDMEIEPLVSARATFGGPTESALQDMQVLLGRDEAGFLDHLFAKSTGQWHSVTKESRQYGSAWLRALNNQVGQDPVARKVMETILAADEGADWTDDVYLAVRNFLKNTDEGKEAAARVPWRSADPDKWTENLVEEIGHLTANFDEELMRGALNSKLTIKNLERIDDSLRPESVHAEIIDEVLGRGVVHEAINDTISTAYDVFGRLPTDTLSRQPFFKQLYASKMRRLEKLAREQGDELTEQTIQRMSAQARQSAIVETRKYLYDLAEVSRFGHMMRFMLPFYAAWQEVIKVWGGLALADPSIIGRAHQLWKAPNRAGLVVTDDDGEEYIQLRLSEQTADNLGLTGWKKYVATGGVRVGKGAFNLVLNNPLPGAGPLIQYPVNEAAKRAPDLEASLQFLLPFGVSANSLDILQSPLVRQMTSELTGPENDRSYQRAFVDAVTYMDNLYRRGERTDPPTLEEAHQIAGKIRTIRMITRLASPAQPIFDSPLKPYIDVYRDLIENLGPEKADEVFLNEFGQEFFAVTMSRTVSKTGIPPTVEAEQIREQYEDLITRYPEYGRFILGEDAAFGEFSGAAYASQLQRKVDPSNPFSEVEREYRGVELDPETGRISEVDRRLGWQEYIQAMDLIELRRKERGLPNLRVSEAEDLAQLKRMITQDIAQRYPAWWKDFNERNDLKWDQRIQAFRSIASSVGDNDRVDLQGVMDYIELRDQVLAELNRRKMLGGPATLQATGNQDLLRAWESAIHFLLEDNIAFAPIYFRYLEGDPVTLSRGG